MSVVICCHNSAGRLAEALEALARQDASAEAWEVLVVDNASSDDTGTVAARFWESSTRRPAGLRVVSEPRPGLAYARLRGLDEARFPLVSFVDDDNLVDSGWVKTVQDLMADDAVGACGGIGRIETADAPRPWFETFQRSYAVGPQAPVSGDVTQSPGQLYGAGLTVRVSAIRRLVECGFKPQLVDRQGRHLRSGGDTEFCFALRLAGLKLHYSDALTFRHRIPRERMTWPYLLALQRSFGRASVLLDAYVFALQRVAAARPRTTWAYQMAGVAKGLLKMGTPRDRGEGSNQAAELEYWRGRARELVVSMRTYNANIQTISELRQRLTSTAAA